MSVKKIFLQSLLIVLSIHSQFYHINSLKSMFFTRDQTFSPTDSNYERIVIDEWNLLLSLNDECSMPVFETLWITDDNITVLQSERAQCECLRGIVEENEENSFAIFTKCDIDFSGLFRIGEEYFEVSTDEDGKPQVVKKRHRREIEEEIDKEWQYFNLTGDIIHFGEELDDYDYSAEEVEEINEVANLTEMWDWRRDFKSYSGDDVGYFFDSTWQPEVITKKSGVSIIKSEQKWLEIAIAVDHTVISFHGKTRVEKYVLSLMNIVNAIYQDPSMDANIQLVLTRLLLYNTKKQSVVRSGNAKKSLENVNSWNSRLHISLAPGETHHDIAVWLTRADIGGPSGYAPVSGVCDPKRSCSLNRDEGLTSAFIIAHEMAHILGLSHDGDKKAHNNCANEAMEGSIMAAMVSATFHKFSWSECSRKEFKKKSRKWTCLSNPPGFNSGEIVLNATLDISFTMDEQCRMEFGDGYALCRAFDITDPCAHLWCGHEKSPFVCKTKKGPPLEGTECGFDKWCIGGYCQLTDKRKLGMTPVLHNPLDGGWGEWGPWGTCSRTCGTGASFRIRSCNKPTPSYGGDNCFGKSEEWQLCNVNTCPEPVKDIRMQQCRRLPKFLNMEGARANLTWLPYESEESTMKCKLICMSRETKELYVTDENLIDGTPCSYEVRNNICIQGSCHTIGCNHELLSPLSEDLCGVCGGNNSLCSHLKTTFTRKLRRDTSRIAILPRFAREINIKANFTTTLDNDPLVAFVLKDRKRKTYTITIPNAGVYSDIIEGAKFYYKKISDRHHIWAKGPLLTEMVVLVYSARSDIKRGINATILLEYYMNNEILSGSRRYQWILGGWGPCSKSCDIGRRHKTTACFDTNKKKIVPRKFCSLAEKPTLESEKCNIFSFHWISGGWEPCSATCGSSGTQHREIFCVPQSITYSKSVYQANDASLNVVYGHMVSPSKCGVNKPLEDRVCNKVECLMDWEYGEWSKCSTSCGSGLSTRHAICPPPVYGETLFSCPSTPRNVRHCQENNRTTDSSCHRRGDSSFCVGNLSKFCTIPELFKYCRLGSFRRLCCKVCATALQTNLVI